MTRALVATRIRLANALEERLEKGQGTLEYVGMIALAAVLVAAVVGVFKGANLGSTVSKAIAKITSI